jgi:hypothetical protein
VRTASDFDRIASDIATWHGFDSAVKAELYSTYLTVAGGAYLIDPIPLESETLDELVGSGRVAGVVVTNCNHHRAATGSQNNSRSRSSRVLIALRMSSLVA